MNWLVAKYGGTSLATPERVERVATYLHQQQGPLAVVVSALGDTTDRLVRALDLAASGDRLSLVSCVDAMRSYTLTHPLDDAARDAIELLFTSARELLLGVSILREAAPSTRDLVLSHGERISTHVVSAALRRAGMASAAIDSRLLVHTAEHLGQTHVQTEHTYQAIRDAAAGWSELIPVITGFIASDAQGRTTTLGRGGSDYSASLFGRALGAKEVQIWSDVPGVMTADPQIVEDAWPLRQMTYGEALELATFGARVLHPRTLIPLLDSAIPMRIRSSFDPGDAGTLVDAHGADDAVRATCVTSLESQALLDLRFARLQYGSKSAEQVHRALEEAQIQVWLATHSAHGQAISVVVPQAQAKDAQERLEQTFERSLVRGDLEPIRIRDNVALVTLVAEAMGQTANVAGRMFGALGAIGVNVHGIGQSATARSISCVVDEDDLHTAVRSVHTAFNLTHQRIHLVLLGAGTVGSELLKQIATQQASLRTSHDVLPVLSAVITGHARAIDPSGLDPTQWEKSASPIEVNEPTVTNNLLDTISKLEVPVLVDCTAAEGMQELYTRALDRGIHVVAANKKPLTIATRQRNQLLERARKAHRAYHYETTVGAALPIVQTVRDLVRTGDVVRRVEGSFSGTLGYLCDRLSQGVKLSAAVREAMQLGYTEPRPQEDLAGLDAARKALILARELGLQVELDEALVEPLIPASVLQVESVDAFLDALEEAGRALEERVASARERGGVLRYLAVVDPNAEQKLVVKPTVVDPMHPAYALRGSQALVAITTDRYPDYPLVVQGAGAGGAVTASGVLADIIRIAKGLRGG